MTPATAHVLRIAASVLATCLVGVPALWGGLALWFRAPGGRLVRWLCACAWGAFSLTMLAALWTGRWVAGFAAFGAGWAILLIWWQRVRPTNEADWADDVAQMTRGTVDGDRVTLHKVRNFDWRGAADYTQRWETRTYDLAALHSVDMIMSYWRGPAIAHMLISFGFGGQAGQAAQGGQADHAGQANQASQASQASQANQAGQAGQAAQGSPAGQAHHAGERSHVVFSVEIRRKAHQQFSELGGFFKEFELSIIAAEELDAVRLRTNVRGERVHLYRLRLPRTAMRRLFLGYVQAANDLVTHPRFYHTVTVNCTTLVYQMMRRIVGRLPLSYRLLYPGYMPEYVYSVGGLDRRFPLEELRERGFVSERARQSAYPDNFSADIRRGIPELDSERHCH
jgi:hypothetical protein